MQRGWHRKEENKIMILGKIIRSGGLVASGVLLGSLLSYNSMV